MTAEPGREQNRALRVGAPLVLLPLLPLLWLHLVLPGDDRILLVVDDLGEMFYAALAAGTAGWRAHQSRGRLRKAWTAFAVGAGAWAVGEAIWSWYDLQGQEPFPTLADAGFLVLPVAACVGLWLYPGTGGSGSRQRQLVDAFTVTVALAFVSWATVLGAVFRAGGADRLSFVVGLAYPVGDLAVLTMCLIRFSTGRRESRALLLVASGLASFMLADSVFGYFGAVGRDFPSWVNLGWWLGLALLALAPLAAPDTGEEGSDESVTSATQQSSILPYIPVGVATLIVLAHGVKGYRLDLVDVALFLLTAGLVILRQFLTAARNTRLTVELATSETLLRHAAFHDPLTGLANRALFHDRVAHAIELHTRDRRPLALVFCDLDDFKVINDTLGHRAGDELLVRLAERWRGALRSGDTLARLGGDEFAVLLEDGGEALLVAAKLMSALDVPFELDGHLFPVRVSIGVTSVPSDAPTPTVDLLLGQADIAMYAAKRGGKGALRSFEPGMSLVEAQEAAYVEPLLEALLTRTLGVVYQPIVDLRSGEVVGVEALARWERDGVAVPPSTFVPLAERAGLSGLLADVVLEVALAQLAAWNDALGHRQLTVAVNVSPHQFVDRSLPERVAAVLTQAGVKGNQLVLEVTESALLSDPDLAREVADRLRRLGVRLSLDDFGTGYSSLVHLQSIELDLLKIDRAFVEGIAGSRQTRLVKAILAFGKDLGFEVIAEGVECPEQLQRLRALGCNFAQGFLLARPSPAAELLPLLRDGLPTSLLPPPRDGLPPALPPRDGFSPSQPSPSVPAPRSGHKQHSLPPQPWRPLS